jgi:hypothetical protein
LNLWFCPNSKNVSPKQIANKPCIFGGKIEGMKLTVL